MEWHALFVARSSTRNLPEGPGTFAVISADALTSGYTVLRRKRKNRPSIRWSAPTAMRSLNPMVTKAENNYYHAHYILDQFGPKEIRAVPETGSAFFNTRKKHIYLWIGFN